MSGGAKGLVSHTPLPLILILCRVDKLSDITQKSSSTTVTSGVYVFLSYYMATWYYGSSDVAHLYLPAQIGKVSPYSDDFAGIKQRVPE